MPGAPGRIISRLVPIAEMRSSTLALLPLPMASMATTAPTPMTTPSNVRAVRKIFICSERNAILMASPNSLPNIDFLVDMIGVASVGTAAHVILLRVSSSTLPSASRINRCACEATSASCVISSTVRPSALSSASNASTSAPLWLSSAPVGSSARITAASFISARAMETRCCCPPESCVGLWSPRASSPSRLISICARDKRSPCGLPA